MSIFSSIYNLFIYQPLYNALISLYNIIPDLGIAIIIFTVIIRLLLLPVSRKTIESQKKMQELQPELKKIQERFKDDRQKQAQAQMELYKKHGTTPFSGCLPMIITIVFLFALFKVFNTINPVHADLLYKFVQAPANLHTDFFGVIDLTKPSIILAALAAASQYWQTKMMMAKNALLKAKDEKPKDSNEPDFATIMQSQMLYLAPIMTFFFGVKFFAASLALYWLISNLFMIGQQYVILRSERKSA